MGDDAVDGTFCILAEISSGPVDFLHSSPSISSRTSLVQSYVLGQSSGLVQTYLDNEDTSD